MVQSYFCFTQTDGIGFQCCYCRNAQSETVFQCARYLIDVVTGSADLQAADMTRQMHSKDLVLSEISERHHTRNDFLL